MHVLLTAGTVSTANIQMFDTSGDKILFSMGK